MGSARRWSGQARSVRLRDLCAEVGKGGALQRWFDGPSTRMSSPECSVLLVSTRVTGREHGLGAVSWLSSSSTAFVSASSSEGERR